MKLDQDVGALGPLALYVHIPFCASKCPYCDFNTYSGIEPLMPDYAAALQREVAAWGSLLGQPAVKTVFFGGGTPSYLPAGSMGSVFDAVCSHFNVDPEAEVTLEANPDDLNPSKLEALADMGVNRLSIGVQSLSDRLLETLGRRHSASDAVRACRAALDAGFDNVSVDLMYGLPRQTLEDWRGTLRGVIEMAVPHASMYCLTLEDGTPLKRIVDSGGAPNPDPDLAADMYLAAQEAMGGEGYCLYEISNWARPGFESRHNMIYWRNQPYLGVGPGAHSYIGSTRFSNLRSPREYIRRLRESGAAPRDGTGLLREAIETVPVVEAVEHIDRRLEMAETLMLGLRLTGGVEIEEFAGRFGVSPDSVYGGALEELREAGLVDRAVDRLKLTDRGRMLGNEVFSRFFE